MPLTGHLSGLGLAAFGSKELGRYAWTLPLLGSAPLLAEEGIASLRGVNEIRKQRGLGTALKSDEGEDLSATAGREMSEEGWSGQVETEPFYTMKLPFSIPAEKGVMCLYRGIGLEPVVRYKERHRGVYPVWGKFEEGLGVAGGLNPDEVSVQLSKRRRAILKAYLANRDIADRAKTASPVVARVIGKALDGRFALSTVPSSQSGRQRGWLDFPGGHVDPGESSYQAAKRELGEEGWTGKVERKPFYTLKIDSKPGYEMTFHRATDLKPKTDYLERGRGVFPVTGTFEEGTGKNVSSVFAKALREQRAEMLRA